MKHIQSILIKRDKQLRCMKEKLKELDKKIKEFEINFYTRRK